MEESATCSACGCHVFYVFRGRMVCPECKREYVFPDETKMSDLVDMVNCAPQTGVEAVSEDMSKQEEP